MADIDVLLIRIRICTACLAGIGQECHTPGCALFLHTVDLPVSPEVYEVLAREPANDE